VKRAVFFATIFLISFALILAVLWFFSSEDKSEPIQDNQDNSQSLTIDNGSTEDGKVAVTVTLLTEGNSDDFEANGLDLDSQYAFYVEMNTHSVDIVGYKMEEISFLRYGTKTLKASSWRSATEGGTHHRNGFLLFSKNSDVKKLELVIKGIAGVAEREFKWSL